jgi:hypothetical protein
MDEIIEPYNPYHVGIVLIESDECEIASQCMMIPVTKKLTKVEGILL